MPSADSIGVVTICRPAQEFSERRRPRRRDRRRGRRAVCRIFRATYFPQARRCHPRARNYRRAPRRTRRRRGCPPREAAPKVLSDKKNWVAWTPEGFYDATPGALLPYGVDAGMSADLKASAISADEFRHEVAELAKYGRVLVLLTPVIRAPPPATARH